MVLLAVPVFAGTAGASRPDGPPNIILVFIDDMGWADLSCFGNEAAQTPQIDRMAAEGIAFEQFYVNSPICSPSRVAISTGQYPQRWCITSYLDNRVRNAQRGMAQWLDPKAPMLARSLKEAGYATGHFGKWHMGGQRDVDDAPPITAYGFDESLTNFEGMGPKLLPATMKPEWEEPSRIWANAERLGGPVEWRQRSTITGGFVEAALKFMERAQAAGKPFYVNLWPDDVHSPFFPPVEKWGKTKRELYHAVLEEMDRQLGSLFAHVRERPALRDNTLVLICSDNGHEPGAGQAGPLWGCKTNLYEGGIRSSLVVWGPGLMAAERVGKRNKESVFSAIDLVPSLLRLGGAEAPADVVYDGEEVLDTLLGKSRASRQASICFGRPPDRKNFYGMKDLPDLAVRHGKWKLLCDVDGSRARLFDVVADPAESRNLAEESPEHVARLVAQARAWHQQTATVPAVDLELDYQRFDQTPGEGWRPVADAGLPLQAARLIDSYASRRPGLNLRQRINLSFHAGQLYAFGGAPVLARKRLQAAIHPDEPSDSPLRWNAYVKATIAFLEQDMEALQQQREEMAAGPRVQGRVPNLDVVDRLIRHFGQPYEVAYRSKD